MTIPIDRWEETRFEITNKRRKASESQVRKGARVVDGHKELREKRGRNDLCPGGSGRRFQKMLPALRRFTVRR